VNAVPHVVLVGLPGAGKSTVARAVADRLRVEFVDLDAEIEQRAGVSIHELFGSAGEPEFRRLEAEATRDLLARPSPGLIAAGGGWIANARARELVPTAWAILYLRVSPLEAATRLGRAASSRPLLADAGSEAAVAERLEELAGSRGQLYQRADLVVETDGIALEEVVERVATAVSPLLSGGRTRARSTQ
jgi:shikimate kinase